MGTIRKISQIRSIIRRVLLEVGRNYHTVNTNPISYKDFKDYEVEIYPSSDGYALNVFFRGEKISHSFFKDYEEANHRARSTVEKHRTKFMNSIR